MTKKETYLANKNSLKYRKRWKRGEASISSENEHQRAVVDWLRHVGIDCFAVPNHRTQRESGALAGAPDLVLMAPSFCGKTVALEMKRPQKSVVSSKQIEVHNRLEQHGWIVVIGYGADDAINKLERVYRIDYNPRNREQNKQKHARMMRDIENIRSNNE